MPHGLNALDEFILTVVMSCKVVGHKPLSTLIIGLPDSGKTEILMQYDGVKKVDVENDITSFGLTTLLPRIQNGEVKTIVIPDLSRISEGRGKAGEGLIAAFNSLIEEGVLNIKTFNVRFNSDKPVQCNVLAGLTIKSYDEDKKRWGSLGFLSRIVPFFLAYCPEDMDKGLATIKNGINPFRKITNIDLDTQVDVSMSMEQKNEIERIAKFIAKINADYTAFRSYKNLLTLAKSHAIVKGRTTVSNEDIRFIIALMPFWFEPHGNDCEFYVIKNIPASREMIIQQLAFLYTRETTDKAIFMLLKKRILIEENGKLVLNKEVNS